MMKISPYDILFFRESRDFSAGENHVAESIEPLPHTIAGAIMGAVFEKGRLDLLNLRKTDRGVKKIPTPENWKPNFSILGTFFGFERTNGEGEARPLFALPMDLVEVEGGIAPLRVHHLPDGRMGVVAEVKGKKVLHFGPKRGFITAEVLERYLSGDLNDGFPIEANIREVKDVYERETRIGIGLNEKKTTEEGLLYRISALRLWENVEKEALERTAILVYFEPDDEKVIENTIGKNGLLKLGGESRFAGFEFKAGT
uniref:type III-B CRISPR module-associated protein Cmr3 n=1 Tax=Thermococcus sp. TaxID=35749 RepID=UPI00260B27DA